MQKKLHWSPQGILFHWNDVATEKRNYFWATELRWYRHRIHFSTIGEILHLSVYEKKHSGLVLWNIFSDVILRYSPYASATTKKDIFAQYLHKKTQELKNPRRNGIQLDISKWIHKNNYIRAELCLLLSVREYINKNDQMRAAVSVMAAVLLTLKSLYARVCVCAHVRLCLCLCARWCKWVVADPTAQSSNLFSERKKKLFWRLVCQGWGCVWIKCVFMSACTFICTCSCVSAGVVIYVLSHAFGWARDKQTRVCVGGGVVWTPNTITHNFHFFRSFPFSSPKIGCTPFVTSHECLLNLLWRDLGVNLFPVEKAKLWNHKPKNKSRVTLGKPFMVLVGNVFVWRSIAAVLIQKSRGQWTRPHATVKQQRLQFITSLLRVAKMKVSPLYYNGRIVWFHWGVILSIRPNVLSWKPRLKREILQ